MLTVAQIKRRKTTLGGFLAPLCFFNRIKLHFRISLHPIVTEIYQPFLLIWNFRNVTQIEKTNTFFCSTNVHLLCLFVSADTSQNLTHTHRNVLKITHSSFSAKRPVCKQLWRSFWNCSATFNWFNHGEVTEIATLKEMEQTREEKGGKGGSAWQKRESFGA